MSAPQAAPRVRPDGQTPRVHLARVGLRGFKSFPDPVELRFEPGVAILVGPNGSGKSNVADAIVWASGSLSPTELRAEKPDDVLFGGAGERAPAAFCEVELQFGGADGVGGLDFSTLAIARRLHRGGEGQYLVNGASVRRTDVVELLAELGLGRSIVGQGRVEEILSSRPAELRALVEDAAGLGVFKRRRHRAELKLARVATQVERAHDVEKEVRARIRPLALQATAAERAEKLSAEVAALESRLAALDAARLEEGLAELDERRTATGLARRRSDERLEALLVERRAAEDELEDAAGRREAATAALYRMRSGAERLAVRSEGIGRLVEPLRRDADESERAAAEEPAGPSRAQLEAAAAAARAEEVAAAGAERVARDRLAALERVLEEREGLPPAARALAERGERLVLSELEVAPGDERAVTAALGARASALVASDPQAALRLLDQAREEGLGGLTVVLEGALREDVRIVERDELLDIDSGLAATRDGYAYDPARGELRFAGEPAEALVLELEARRKTLAEEAEDAAKRTVAAAAAAGEAEHAAREAAARPAPRRLGDPRLLRALAALAERTDAELAAAAGLAARLEAPLRARVDAGAVRAGEIGAELRRLGAAEAELRREAAEAGERAAALEVELAQLTRELAALRERAGEAAAEEDEDRDEVAARLVRTRRRLEGIGPVNPLAKQEAEQERERLAELVAQREDLERSLAELEGLRAELTETVERRFEETFAAVREGFADVAATLFPGGEGRLRLSEPEDEEEAEAPGVEIELRPAGKKVTRLSLLSGGERSLGAIAFLFALFLARPCPFYLLDEVDAALDDANIGRFVELLRRYADRAQFVVVTHQKRTMDAADVLYGVTMGPDGVSQVVSRRQPRDDAVALAATA
jgi:chromosome segregation protein